MKKPVLVLDTNVALDLLVFDDTAVTLLQAELAQGKLQWLATEAMRGEFERVLGYDSIVCRRASGQLELTKVMMEFDRQACIVEAAAKAPVNCSDPDDQKFIDLAVAHRCLLLSKDKAVLTMKTRLQRLGAGVASSLAASSYSVADA